MKEVSMQPDKVRRTDPAITAKDILHREIPGEEKDICLQFLAFPDSFCVDWFAGAPDVAPSRLISALSFLERRQWIVARPGEKGVYEWTKKLPREEIVGSLPPEQMAGYYRCAADLLQRQVPVTKESLQKAAQLSMLAGLREQDLESVFTAALTEEENHRISSAIRLYEGLLQCVADLAQQNGGQLSRPTIAVLIRAVERRASLSLFHPNLKQINRFLSMAIDRTTQIEDALAQASLHLLIGQNYWMAFQHEKAVAHFDTGWRMIEKGEKNALYRRGLQLQALSSWIRGELPGAVQAYEDSLGELDFVAADDFSQLIALHMALCYTQVGMPQRGLGISETIYNQAKRNANGPLVSCALATTGIIFLEIRQLKNSRTYFEMALDVARRENIPMAEVMAGIGLANIFCLEGNHEQAAEHFKVLWKLRKSSWYHTLNSPHVFETGYMLHRQAVSPVQLDSVVNFLYSLKNEHVNPYLYGIIRHRQIQMLEEDKPPAEKIRELLEIEQAIERSGGTLELARIRISLTRLLLQTNNWKQAESYAAKAWEILKPVARDVFPRDLMSLAPQDDLLEKDRLFDLVIEMGEALTSQKQIEQLLSNIISSISRLTGAERAALFIRGKDAKTLDMAASRNLTQESLKEEAFRETIERIRAATQDQSGGSVQYDVSVPGDIHFRRVIITPLPLGRRVIGALYQDSRFFSLDMSPDRRKLLSALASQIAVSIDRSQAYDEIARLNERLVRENVYYQEEKEEFRPFGDIIGGSEGIMDIHRLIARVAPTLSTVLISGETGVGKELIARAIHRESPRHKEPFIRVNCAALPESLIDSELFGHERGAFTGAHQARAGRFELAHNGTIFLDEVSELPPATQSRLLRILQEKEYQRVGGTKMLHADFRLITATNKDLQKEVARGRFRDDLYYRLNVFPVKAPPLRDRREDIPLLAMHFLKHFCARYNKCYSGITETEMEKLKAYSWPGNIRELANMVERAVILGGPRIRFLEMDAGRASGPDADPDAGDPLTLQEAERLQILKALKRTHGQVGGKDGAAVRLGLKRTTLINRMKKLGIKLERSPAQAGR
jgi:transcriptional regulator with GAF, ATPase, and Fis domain